jgi:hypothetical protein
MSFMSFSQRLKALFVAESLLNIFADYLYRLPMPYWLTCTVTGLVSVGFIAWNGVLRDNPVLDFNNSVILLRQIGLIFTIPYGLYIYWHIRNDIKSFNNLIIVKQSNQNSNKTSSRIPWISNTTLLMRGIFRVIIVIGLAYIALTVSSNILMTVLAFVVLIITVLPIILTLNILKEGIQVITSIYNLKFRPIEINLFNLLPLHQLSNLTKKLSFYLLPLATIMGLAFTPILTDKELPTTTIGVGVSLFYGMPGPLLIAISIFVFIYPVFWIRTRIIETKNDLLQELGTMLQKTIADQDQLAQDGDYIKSKNINDYTNALISREEYIKNISEWPWETRVIREFSAAIIIPIFLWVVQFYLTSLLGK